MSELRQIVCKNILLTLVHCLLLLYENFCKPVAIPTDRTRTHSVYPLYVSEMEMSEMFVSSASTDTVHYAAPAPSSS